MRAATTNRARQLTPRRPYSPPDMRPRGFTCPHLASSGRLNDQKYVSSRCQHASGRPEVRPERHAPRRARRHPQPGPDGRAGLRRTRRTVGTGRAFALPDRALPLAARSRGRGSRAGGPAAARRAGSGSGASCSPPTTPARSSSPSMAVTCGAGSCFRIRPPICRVGSRASTRCMRSAASSASPARAPSHPVRSRRPGNSPRPPGIR